MVRVVICRKCAKRFHAYEPEDATLCLRCLRLLEERARKDKQK
jgi:hypothetical protein